MLELSYFVAFTFIFFVCLRILHMTSHAELPQLFFMGCDGHGEEDSSSQTKSLKSASKSDGSWGYVAEIIKHAPLLTQPYIPPLLWGKSGHLQTIIHSTIGRHKAPREKGDSRHEIILSDGSLVTFDLFQPLFRSKEQGVKEGVTLVMCPGIGNSSETVAIKTFSHHANENGYRVAVLNHLGVLPHIPLTTPRIFNYGSTEEFGAMVHEVKRMYPSSPLIAVGFSMGANIVCKYLGESPEHRKIFTAGISVCQAYDIVTCLRELESGKHMGKFYLRALAKSVEKVIHNFQDLLVCESTLRRYQVQASREKILHCSSLPMLDALLLAKMAGHSGQKEYYKWASSSNYIPQIDLPMLFINAADDPLTPEPVFEVPKQHARANSKSLFVLTKHGGHLGFFESQEGRLLSRGTYTWLDKVIVQYVDALVKVTASQRPVVYESSC